MRDTEGTIGKQQNKTYNSYQSGSSINPKTKDIYSKHHRMATHHWIIICGIKHHVQVGITAGCGRVDRVKDEDGDVDEDDHRGDDGPSGILLHGLR